MNHTSSLFAGLFALIGVFIVACDWPSTRQVEMNADRTPIVGVIANRTTPYWKAVEFGANHSADKNNLRLIWHEIAQSDNFDQQVAAIHDLSTRRVQGIIIATHNELMLREAIERAQNQGIQVLLIDSPPLPNTENHADQLPVVTTDQYHAGQLAAGEMAELLQEKGRVAIIRYSPLSWKTEKREEGFLAQIRSYPEIKVVGHDLYTGTDPRVAKEKLTNFLQLYSWNGHTELDGIFISDESTACEMLDLIEQKKYENKMIFMAFGTDARLVTGLLTYRVDAFFVEQPAGMGQQAVDTMAEMLRGQNIAPFRDAGVHYVTIDNLYSPYSQALLTPISENSLEILLNESPDNPNPSDSDENDE